jgi:hypothetical protein
VTFSLALFEYPWKETKKRGRGRKGRGREGWEGRKTEYYGGI